MPTSHCDFPQHHSGPSAGPPLGLLAAVAAGAVIVAEWHTVLIVLAVVAVLAVLGVLVLMLVHSHRSVPYDAAWADSEPRELRYQNELRSTPAAEIRRPQADLQARVAELEQRLAAQRAIDQSAQHQHLHLHGLTAEDMAAVVSQQAPDRRSGGALEHRQ